MAYPQRPWLVQDIIKERSFTLLAGSSASGKSTLIFQNTDSWIKQKKFLGYQCYRVPQRIWYIAFDRLLNTAHDQLALMDIDFEDHVDLQSFATIDVVKQTFHLPQCSEGDLIIMEGLDFFVKDIVSFKAVSDLCRECVQAIQSMGISIIGIVGGNKIKGKDEGTNHFDRISGSGVWQRITETNMVMEATTKTMRTLHIRPRFAAEVTQYYRVDKGRLVESASPDDAKTPQGFLVLLPDGVFTLQQAVMVGIQNAISERTVYRLMNYLVDDQKALEKVAHGRYRKKGTPLLRFSPQPS